MKFKNHNRNRRHGLLQAVAVLSLLLMLCLLALAASPKLHELIHKDAGRADHQCAVTLFAHGQVDAVDFSVAVAGPFCAAEFFPSPPVSIFSSAFEMLPPGRAPPVLPSVS